FGIANRLVAGAETANADQFGHAIAVYVEVGVGLNPEILGEGGLRGVVDVRDATAAGDFLERLAHFGRGTAPAVDVLLGDAHGAEFARGFLGAMPDEGGIIA